METNFFQAIAGMELQGDLKITVSKGTDNQLIVSLLLRNDKVGDDAKNLIPPMVFRGTAAEIDEAFFEKITIPLKQTDGLLTNMEQYLKQVEEAKLQSKLEKDKEEKQRREKEERKKKYEGMMKKVNEAEEGKKYQEAIAAMPKEKDFPEYADEIMKRMESLRAKNGQLALL